MGNLSGSKRSQVKYPNLRRLALRLVSRYDDLPGDIRDVSDPQLDRVYHQGGRVRRMLKNRVSFNPEKGRSWLRSRVIKDKHSLSDFLLFDLGGLTRIDKKRRVVK